MTADPPATRESPLWRRAEASAPEPPAPGVTIPTGGAVESTEQRLDRIMTQISNEERGIEEMTGLLAAAANASSATGDLRARAREVHERLEQVQKGLDGLCLAGQAVEEVDARAFRRLLLHKSDALLQSLGQILLHLNR